MQSIALTLADAPVAICEPSSMSQTGAFAWILISNVAEKSSQCLSLSMHVGISAWPGDIGTFTLIKFICQGYKPSEPKFNKLERSFWIKVMFSDQNSDRSVRLLCSLHCLSWRGRENLLVIWTLYTTEWQRHPIIWNIQCSPIDQLGQCTEKSSLLQSQGQGSGFSLDSTR